jgi:hypothetical protein
MQDEGHYFGVENGLLKISIPNEYSSDDEKVHV